MTSHGDSIKSQRPLAGVILCCTSISADQRTELATVAEQMGAAHKYDLTSDVTHLVVGYTDTQKYKYVAKERPDVKVVLPEWISAVREAWMTGDDIDVAALEQTFQAPPFHSLRISITGFDDLVYRQTLSETIEKHGAEYSGDLTKVVTHLVVARPEGKKYSYALQWNIKVVSEKWLHDSITRGMALEEAAYDPLKPNEEQGKGAFNVMAAPASRLGKRDREEAAEPDRRKLRRTASAKLGSQNEGIWQDIASHTAGDRRRSESQWEEAAAEKQADTRPQRSTSITRPSSRPTLQLQSSEEKQRDSNESIFAGRIVYLHAFNRTKTAILTKHLDSHGARLCRSPPDLEVQPLEDLEQGFVVVPEDVPATKIPPLPEAGQRLLRVTIRWVEKCLESKTLVDPVSDVLCKPFPSFPLEGFAGMTIATSGIQNFEKLHVSKAIELLGGTYQEYLTKSTSTLVCNPERIRKEKLEFAGENRIPVVSLDWLLHSIDSAARKPFEEYLIQTLATTKDEGVRITLGKTELHSKARPQDTKRESPVNPPTRRQVPQRANKSTRPDSSTANTKAEPTKKPKSPFVDDESDTDSSPPTPEEDSVVPPLYEDSVVPLGPPSPQPLRELPSASINSPRHPTSTSASTKSSSKSTHATSPPPAKPMSPSKPDLTDQIAFLLAQKQASRSLSANASPVDQPETNRQRRRRGLLGRAPSMHSNPSTNDPAESSNANANVEGTEDGERPWYTEQEPLQQTQLVYEDPDALKAREALLKKMGSATEKRERSAPIGMVKDAEPVARAGDGGGRTRRKR